MGAATATFGADGETCSFPSTKGSKIERDISGASSGTRQLEALARELFLLLTDGYEGPLRYSVARGFPLRAAETKRLVRACYSRGWAAAQEVAADGTTSARAASPWALLHHLQGRYDVAIEQPSWTSRVVLDLDCHVAGAGLHEEELAERTLKARLDCDERLERVLSAYDVEGGEGPVVLRTPSGGYHVYLFHDRPWPAAWLRQWHEYHLAQRGLFLEPGRLELYPSGVPLRAPCGLGMLLLDARREPVAARRLRGKQGWSWRRDVAAMTAMFLDRARASKRPLEQWLGLERPAWDDTWGPWAAKELLVEKTEPGSEGGVPAYRHIVEVRGAGACPPLPSLVPSTSLLLTGQAWRVKITRLLAEGVREVGTRHDAALKVAWYHQVQRGLPPAEAVAEVERWLRLHNHVRTGKEPLEQWLRQTLREVRHYCTRHLAKPSPTPRVAPAHVGLGELADADLRVVAQAPAEVREEVRVLLTYLGTYADPSGRVASWVPLGTERLEALCGQRRLATERGKQRAAVVALAWLQEKGVIALHQDYSTGRHVRRYTVWYQFRTGALPAPDPAVDRERPVLGRRQVTEGELVVLLGERFPEVRLLPGPNAADTPHAWWRRMFARRAFVPGELWGAHERRVIPAPFRDRPNRKPVEPREEGRGTLALTETLSPVYGDPVAIGEVVTIAGTTAVADAVPAAPITASDPAYWDELERRARALPAGAGRVLLERIAEWRARYRATNPAAEKIASGP